MNVKADIEKNRLYLKLPGKISKREWEGIYTEVRFCVADLHPGFQVIADYSESSLVSVSGIPTFRKLMNYLIRNGVGEVVRVVDSHSLLFKQVVNLSSRICGYKPIYAHSVEEAGDRLDAAFQRNGLRFHYKALPQAEYSTDDAQTGTGCILNISTSGCAIGSATLVPSMNAEIGLRLAFTTEKDTIQEFKIKARVVRIEENGFATTFLDFDGDQKDQMMQCLLRESEREL